MFNRSLGEEAVVLSTLVVGESFVKVEDTDCDKGPILLEYIRHDLPILEHKSTAHKSLAGGVGIPSMRWYREECDFYLMIYDLLGPSLESLFNFCDRKSSLKTVLQLADQLIPRV